MLIKTKLGLHEYVQSFILERMFESNISSKNLKLLDQVIILTSYQMNNLLVAHGVARSMNRLLSHPSITQQFFWLLLRNY